MAAPVIHARGVTKQYGPLRALGGVDLDIEQGEVFSLLGPNGAGKTTFVEILEGYRQRSGGDVTVLGVDPGKGNARWRSKLGIVLQSASMFEQLTVEEVVRHFATFYPDPMPVDRVIELTGLQEKRTSTVGKLSGGQRRRVDVALGIIGNPELIFLDEPTTGFDPAARRQAWEVVRGLTSLGKTVLLTTHYLDEAEQLANRVGVIISGKLVALGTPTEIGGRSTGSARVSFDLPGALAERPLPGVDADPTRGETGVSYLTATPTALVAVLAAWAQSAGVEELPGLTISRPSLEDVYLDMIAAHQQEPAAEVAA